MLDDDKPDYFIADEAPEETTQAGSNTIDFAPDMPTPDSGGSPKPHKSHLMRKILWTGGLIAVVVLAVAFYLRYVSPYATDAVMHVYVVSVEKRGLIFKTYEAQVVSAEALADTSQIYSHPEQFTVSSEALANRMQQVQGQKIPITLEYEKFYATLPWRGASKWVVTDIK